MSSRKRPREGPQSSTECKKGMIIALRQEGHTFRYIGQKIGASKSAVHRMWSRYCAERTMNRRSVSGRPRKTTVREDNLIIREIKKDRFVTVPEIKERLPLLQVSLTTIRCRVHESDIFKSYFAARKPFISEINRIKRVTWAKEHLNWSLEQWKEIMWSDESPYVLRSKSKRRVWRRENERFSPMMCTVGTLT